MSGLINKKIQQEKANAHNWLRMYKGSNGISYRALADIMDYSAAGVNKGLRQNTLSMAAIKKVVDYYGVNESFEKYIQQEVALNSNDDGGKKDISSDIQELADIALMNFDELMKDERFKKRVEVENDKAVIAALQEMKSNMKK